MTRQEFGDWQTPYELAEAALSRVAEVSGLAPATVLEPTCGKGAFLLAAKRRFGDAQLVGFELNEEYALHAQRDLGESRASVRVADFFCVQWERELAALPEPILVTGNPPWVTNSILGVLGSHNLPEKRNFKGLSGFDALTGKSNFDVSEWMILRLLAALQGRRATLAVLCKSAVARRVIEFAAAKRWQLQPGGVWQIDAKRHFDAAVDAVLFVAQVGEPTRSATTWPIYQSLDAGEAGSAMAVVDGTMIADIDGFRRTVHLVGCCEPEWRSGLKHDCSRVMELTSETGAWRNGLGDSVELEEQFVFPLLKSSDVANGVSDRSRAVIVPQRALGEDTARLAQVAPKTWSYLSRHADLLAARKSSIYRGQPPFSVFGIGSYSFAPWKVAISGLYKRCEFALVGPNAGKPVMLDDTCYFLPYESEAHARRAWEALQSPVAKDFFSSRIFWDAKRPINKAMLQQLDLHSLIRTISPAVPPRSGEQIRLAL